MGPTTVRNTNPSCATHWNIKFKLGQYFIRPDVSRTSAVNGVDYVLQTSLYLPLKIISITCAFSLQRNTNIYLYLFKQLSMQRVQINKCHMVSGVQKHAEMWTSQCVIDGTGKHFNGQSSSYSASKVCPCRPLCKVIQSLPWKWSFCGADREGNFTKMNTLPFH